MSEQLLKANINLYAVLRNLEDLCELDSKARELVQNRNLIVQFFVRNGPEARLQFQNGKCRFIRGSGECDIKLYFRSPRHFNDMVEGKANPIPLKGFTKISFLKNEFTKLTDMLTYYLKPTDELLQNPTYFNINAILTAYTVFFALSEIANLDLMGKMNAARIPDGVISISVNGGPAVQITASKGNLSVKKGLANSPRASMIFQNIETASQILHGKEDLYACIGEGGFELKGFIPMLDNLNKILYRVPSYLA